MVNRMKAAQVALLIGLGAALHPAPAVAAEQSATKSRELKVIPLRTVDNQGGQLELRGQAGQLQFRVPVEAGAKVQDARLRLVYQSADAVRSERSRMWVYLNQQSIAQLPLSSDGDAVRADIVLPPDLLTTGHNTLSLWAQQEGSRGCDADSSAALWTRLDPGNSYLALETAGPDRERNLADLADAGLLHRRRKRADRAADSGLSDRRRPEGGRTGRPGLRTSHAGQRDRGTPPARRPPGAGWAQRQGGGRHGRQDPRHSGNRAICPMSRVPISACVRSRAPARS